MEISENLSILGIHDVKNEIFSETLYYTEDFEKEIDETVEGKKNS